MHGHSGDVATLDPWYLGQVNRPIHNQIYNPLVRYDANLKPQPELAESWEEAPDGSSVTFHLRQGVKFHNGRELVADDVVFNMERVKDAKIGHQLAPLAALIDSAKALDKYTAQVLYKSPQPGKFDLYDCMYILNKETIGQINTKPIGTGPFKFQEWVAGESVKMQRNPDYFRQGKPLVDGFTAKAYNDAQAMTTALLADTVHFIEPCPYSEYGRLKDDKNLTIEISEVEGAFWNIALGCDKKPFDNKQVRQAFQYIVNRKTISEKTFFGATQPIFAPYYLKHTWVYDPKYDNYFAFDLQKAKQMIAAAGYPNGFETTVITFGSIPESGSIAQVMQADAAQIGIKMTIKTMEAAQAYPIWLNGGYDIMVGAQARVNKDPSSLFGIPIYKKDNSAKFRSAEYDRLVDEGMKTLDVEKRKQIYRQLQSIMVDESWSIVVATKPNIWPRRTYLQGYQANIDAFMMLENAWLDK
ncbi:MAG: ABC transporter substrate-binding protein [Chloroflexi bacterium]|nr:ABC transporter substrate-binding protein [Chloroflexota bacterium]MCL5107994.1 ABC transporter substrate-binding protein [Chloroflexota bacterium]